MIKDATTSLLVALLALGAGGAALAQSADGSFSHPFRFLQRDGEVIYRTVCQGCHMPDGQGAVGAGSYPALANNVKLESGGYPVLLVVHGQRAMPPFGDLLDDDQIAAVVNYVRSHFGNDYKDTISAADVTAARR
jgi:mono/diheme cytochrome c family protein